MGAHEIVDLYLEGFKTFQPQTFHFLNILIWRIMIRKLTPKRQLFYLTPWGVTWVLPSVTVYGQCRIGHYFFSYLLLKFGLFEKGTKSENIFYLIFDVTK